MKRSTIPLGKNFGSKALSNLRMILFSASHSRMLLSFAMLVMMMLVPSSVKGVTTIMNFEDVGGSKQNYPASTIVTMGDNYSAISGAKVGVSIAYRNTNGNDGRPNNLTMDISRIAFNFNASAGNVNDGNAGFYIRREKTSVAVAGLYTGSSENKLAILGLKPGNKVTFSLAKALDGTGGDNAGKIKYVQSVHADEGRGDLWNYAGVELTNTIEILSLGDLIVEATQGTYIKSITIEEEIAEYDITTNGNETTFEFTKNGTLEQNDFALPYLSFSMGNINDYLVVQGENKEVHMFKPIGGETLETGGHNYQPSAGSFYEFKPTGGGVVTMEGSLTGTVHLFVYDPTPGTDTWVEKQNNGVFHKLNFPDTNNQNPQEGSDYYDANYSFEDFGNGRVSFSFTVEKDKYYYVCIDNNNDTETGNGYAFHMHKMTFANTFHLAELAKVIDLTNVSDGSWIGLTAITGYGSAKEISTKRCSGSINPPTSEDYMIQNNFLYMKKPTFAQGADNAGTVLIDVKTKGGDAVFVATFPYHADYNPAGYTDTNRTYGHTWNFIDPRNSDTNIGNCWINDGYGEFTKGTTTGILSIGQDKNTNSQFHKEVLNREWTYSQRQTGSSGGFHDPYYVNVWDMVGDNADMIWETEGLWFDTGTNLSCIYNENNALASADLGDPLQFKTLQLLDDQGNPRTTTDNDGNVVPEYTDPDRYVGLLPVTDDKKSSFTIPGLKAGDRVLIFMKSGEGSGANGIFLNVIGAKDAVGTTIETDDTDPDTWYRAGGTNWQHNRYEGCYHFIKDDNVDETTGYGSMTFDMQSGSMCKLLYIRIYTGKRIDTNDIVSTKNNIPDGVDDNGNPKYKSETGKLLFVNDKGATDGDYSQFSLRFRGKGQKSTNRVLTYSGNLNANSFTGNKWKVSGAYNQYIDFTSTVGEIGMFRLRFTDVEYSENYVADFTDRNFTVGYRDKVDSYPYTWDLTDIMNTSYSTAANVTKDATEYKEVDLTQYPNENTGWDISLFDTNGYMKVNSGVDPAAENQIFSSDKKGFGNQLWAYGGVIPEARGLWFYQDEEKGNNPEYNDCLQITSEGLCFVNKNLEDGSHDPWWNYKMVVPDVPADGAVYLRMKRDSRVKETDSKYSDKAEKDVLFLNTRFAWGMGSKTSLTEPIEGSYSSIYRSQENGSAYSFFKVDGTADEYILAVKNTTGETNHLQFTLNGWIVKKLSVSTDYKNIGTTGYATESRTRVIDHSLTEQFTGLPIKAYQAKLNGNKDKAILTEVHFLDKAVNEGDYTGCVLHNETTSDTKEVTVLANGFHLFVPDMHDTALDDISNNVMMAHLNGNNVESSSSTTSYVLSAKYYDKSQVDLDEKTYLGNGKTVAFYRVDPKTGATLAANSAYLQQSVNQARILMFFSDVFGETPTAIETVEPAVEENAVWHNLNGQAINAPKSAGVYIRNGKKVIVK